VHREIKETLATARVSGVDLMLQCQRREALREGMTSFDKLEIGEADLLWNVRFRG
jgi:hypothetical protein